MTEHVQPLLFPEETGLRLRTADCIQIIKDVGLPIPPKSACWFCPHHSMQTWADLRKDHPARFEKAARLEDHMRSRNEAKGLGPIFISRAGIPLRDAVDTGQPDLFDDADCKTGACFT